MTDENIWPWYVRSLEQGIKLAAGIYGVHGRVGWITPPVSRTIIDAHARRFGDRRLHPRPREGRQAKTGFQDDRRRAISRAKKVKLADSDPHRLDLLAEIALYRIGSRNADKQHRPRRGQ